MWPTTSPRSPAANAPAACKSATSSPTTAPWPRKVLEALLDKYADEGITTIESNEVFSSSPSPTWAARWNWVRSFGGRPQYLSALQTLQRELYASR